MYKLLFSVSMIFFSITAFAQNLPADPWASQSPTADRIANVQNAAVPVREGDAVRVRNGLGDSAGDRDKYKMDRTQYTGEATTFGEAYGQEMIAPEVNMTNILMMTNHLRKVGYHIPAEYDEYIKKAPTWYQEKYMQALNELSSASMDKDPITGTAKYFKEVVERVTGLSWENFVNTSFNVFEGK